MGLSADHGSHLQGAASSVAALVAQMQAELSDLVMRREDLERRIRSLHEVTRGGGEIASPAAAKRTIAGRTACRAQSNGPGELGRVNLNLQRACRIALLEADGAASLEEIWARIVRRGSFSFANLESTTPALLQVLDAMSVDGEVHVLESAPCWHWERRKRSHEA